MANCNELFLNFNSKIKLSEEKREMLIGVRNKLRNCMETRYKKLLEEDIGENRIEFQSQGSYVMDTIITPKDEDFDLDDGVYFLGNLSRTERPIPEQFHKWVLHTIGDNENYAQITDKPTCVRVRYRSEGFHIDLPIYYADNYHSPDLAHKEDGWIASNPVEFIAWFEDKVKSGFKVEFLYERLEMYDQYQQWLQDIRKADAQLRRIVRYLKAWSDNLRGEMPPGIIMTILAAENYYEDARDDLSLKNTITNIAEHLENNGFKCLRPTTPKDEDLFKDYSVDRKKYFKNQLNKFIISAGVAINNKNQKEACLKWQKHLGERFPCHLADDAIEGAKTYITPAVIKGDSAKSA